MVRDDSKRRPAGEPTRGSSPRAAMPRYEAHPLNDQNSAADAWATVRRSDPHG